jgi:hypothetical protein
VTGDGSKYGGYVIEETARPTALLWHEHLEGDVEDR